MEENKELNELRNQIAVLKQKLDKEEIVNDRMLRQAMQSNVKNGINNVEIRSLIVGVIALFMVPFMYIGGCRLLFCVFTAIMMIFCISATLFFNRPIHQTDLLSADLKTVAKVMARFKRRNDLWLRYVTPSIIIPWLVWAYIEFCYSSNTDPLSRPGIALGICLLIGSIVGGIIGYTWHRKAVNTAESIIRQIED